MSTGARLAVQGYLQLAEWWITTWGAHATSMATKLDAGTYTADDATKDLSTCAALAAETMVLLVNEAFDAAAVLSGSQDEPNIASSAVFTVSPVTTTSAKAVRTLHLAGPLHADLGNDSLPVAAVSIIPSSLQPSETTFRLEADGTGHAGVSYSGAVQVRDPAGNLVETVSVWIAVA